MDEEHDDSFKQDSDLRYNARNLAVWRAKQSGCPIVLGSATPSLESWHKAKTGAYTLLSLPHRANPAAKLPEITLLDTGRLPLENGFSPQALSLLKDNLQRGGMSLVYLNRRGFAPALFCGDCGHTPKWCCTSARANCAATIAISASPSRTHAANAAIRI